jgi:hypothetical protein
MILTIEKPFNGDPPYHPDEHSTRCLSEKFVNDLLSQIQEEGMSSQELLNVIKEHENIHRSFVMGAINESERNQLVAVLLGSYRENYNRWAHQEDGYQLFYRKVNGGNWA